MLWDKSLLLSTTATMKDDFEITGCFYQIAGFNCRKYLDIRRKGTCLENPDLLAVMMNPGSSRPVGGIYGKGHATEASSDRTQEQIMRVMNNCDLDYGRIINLSDIQQTKSSELHKILRRPKMKKVAHSIFDPRRQAEFDALFPDNTVTILAWGVHDALISLTRMAIEKIGNENAVGLKKNNSELGYYHPLPPSYYKQQEWVSQMTELLKKSNQLQNMQK